MSRLEDNLYSKRILKFKNGKFRVLVLSDIHGIKNYDTRLIRDLDAILDGVKPDVVLLNGDVGWKDAVDGIDTFKQFLSDIVSPIEKRNIPWAHAFGNHDDERGLDNETQFPVYASHPNCLSKHGPDDIDGTANYVLPVYNTAGTEIALNIWALDSHDSMNDYIREHKLNSDPWFFKLPDPLYPYSGYDMPRFSQIMWYWQSSEELNKFAGKKIPGLMFFHIPIPEFITLYRNAAQTKYEGIRRESVGCGPFNSGLFNALVEREEVDMVICGHDHINDFSGSFCNITLAMDGGLSYDGYCDDDIRGGRVVDYNENDIRHPVTYMVRSGDYVEDYPGKCKRIYGEE